MKYAALLRGINVGGNKMIAMSDLRDLVARLGFGDPRTLLQSGNLVFESKARPTAKLEQILETATKKQLGVETVYFVRTADEWRRTIDANPFPAEAKSDPARLIVLFCREATTPASVKAVQSAIVGREVIRGVGREAFVVYPDGMGRSKLTNTILDRGLKTSCTARNWNTVLKIAAALDA